MTRHPVDKQNQNLKSEMLISFINCKPKLQKLSTFHSRYCITSILFTLFIKRCSTDYFRQPKIESWNKLAGCLQSCAKSLRQKTVFTCPVEAVYKKASKLTEVSPIQTVWQGWVKSQHLAEGWWTGRKIIWTLMWGTEGLLFLQFSLLGEGWPSLITMEDTRCSLDTQWLQIRGRLP